MLEASIDHLTTPRLVAERLSLAHFPEINRLYSDPLVMKTLSADGNPMPEEATRKHLQENVEHWEQHGFGLWVFRSRATGDFIGRGGVKRYQIEGKDEIGLAYAVLSDYWKQGYATEMAEATLKIAFEQLRYPEIASWTLSINRASQRVMEKLGFRYERDVEFAGLPHQFYRLTAGEWRERPIGRRG